MRALPLHPQRRALARPPPRQEQGAGRGLAEAAGVEARRRQLAHHQPLERVGVGQQLRGLGRALALGHPQHDAVVAPDRLELQLAALAQPRRERDRPRRVDAAAPGREQAQPPVPDLVARALEHERAVVGQAAGRLALVVQVLHQVARRARVEVVLALEPLERGVSRQGGELAGQLANRAPQLDRSRPAVRLPERHLARLARSGLDQHAVVRDPDDAPARGAEHEHVALAALEHHLLVELAHATARALARGQEDAEEAAVRDRAGVRHDHLLRALARADEAAPSVPHDARPQAGELVRRVAAREHVEHALEGRAAEVGVGGGAAHERVELALAALPLRGDRRDLLREDVERVSRDARLLDLGLLHRLRDRGRRQQVGAELREQDPARDGLDLVAGAADPLHSARDRDRRFDLDHQVDRPHVDPELERRGGNERPELARLERVLDQQPLLARDRAVVGAGDRLARKVVECRGEPLREAARVHEQDRRAVRFHELEQARVHRRPDASRFASGRCRARGRRCRQGITGPRHVLDGHLDAQVENLLRPGVHDRHRPPRPLANALAAAQEARDLLERPLRRRKPDALRRLSRQLLQPLQRQREVRPALGPDDRVDLVHDHGLDGRQEGPRARGQQQEQRLRGRDQDVRRVAQHPRPVFGGRVAGPDRDHGHVGCFAAASGDPGDSRERLAQVLLDVHRERLQRGDVDDAAAVGLRRHRREQEPVDRGEEGGERLARARRREDERALTPGDRRPGQLLRSGRRRERLGEPLPNRRRERRTRLRRAHRPILGDRRDSLGPEDARDGPWSRSYRST